MMSVTVEFEIDSFGGMDVLAVNFRVPDTATRALDFDRPWQQLCRQATKRLLDENQRRMMKGIEL